MKDDEKQQRRDKWRRLVDEYLQSGISQKAFCEQRGLSLPQLVYYHGKFKRENSPQAVTSGFVPVKIQRPEKSSEMSEIKLSLPNGFQCTFPSYIDTVQIKRLVEALLSC